MHAHERSDQRSSFRPTRCTSAAISADARPPSPSRRRATTKPAPAARRPARPRAGATSAPALLFHSEVYRSLAWYLPNIFGNLHARQEWQLFAPLTIGATVRTRSTVVERYLKRGREYVVNEVLVTDDAGRWLQRSRTHQSFLIEEERRGLVVDREREKRSDRQFAVGEGSGERRSRPLVRPDHHRDVRGVLRPREELPHRSRRGADARLPRHRRAGHALGLLRLRAHDAGLRRRLAARRHARRPPGERRLGRTTP